MQFPEPLLTELQSLDRRLLPDQLDDLIVRLCSHRPLGLRELAKIINRSSVYLQNTAIKRLFAKGRLQFQFPNEPNHPRQSYVPNSTPKNVPSSDENQDLDIGRND